MTQSGASASDIALAMGSDRAGQFRSRCRRNLNPLGSRALWRFAAEVPQSPKKDDYRIASAATHRRVRLQVRLRPIALTAQFLHAGADHLEVISSTGLSHVSSSIRLVEL
jgi:hypothetical protein